MLEEINLASEAEQSRKVKSKGSQDNLEGHRSHARMIEQARRTSVDIETISITPSELIDLINTKRQNLEDKHPHPTRDKPTGQDAMWRAFTGHRVPKITQSHEATDKIIKNATSIRDMLLAGHSSSAFSKYYHLADGKTVPQEQLQEIATLVSLANEQYGKGYRNPESADGRPTKEIKTELVMYQKIADRLEQQEKSLSKGEPLRKIDKTLARHLEQWLAQKAIERPNRQREALMHDFAELFPKAAELIRESSSAMQLVQEAATAGVVFAGYAEEGPGKISNAYTHGGDVYVPKAETDPSKTVNSLLFELTNGINQDRRGEVHRMAECRTISAEEFACKIAEIEADAVLMAGEIWTRTGETSKNPIWQQPDPDGYARAYQRYKEGKLTKDALVEAMLKPSPSSNIGNKTYKQQYIDQYNEASLSLWERKNAAFLVKNGS